METRDEWRRLAEKTNNSNAWSTYRLLKCEVRCELREAEKHRRTGHEILGGADVSLPDSRPRRVS